MMRPFVKMLGPKWLFFWLSGDRRCVEAMARIFGRGVDIELTRHAGWHFMVRFSPLRYMSLWQRLGHLVTFPPGDGPGRVHYLYDRRGT